MGVSDTILRLNTEISVFVAEKLRWNLDILGNGRIVMCDPEL